MEHRYSAQSFEVDEDYFLWLCQIVGADDPDQGYLGLLRDMYDAEFTDRTAKFIPNDQNRVSDALKLRDRFVSQSLYDDYHGIFNNPCSCLEILIALAYRMTDAVGYDDTDEWFWEMMENMGLDKYTDDMYFTPRGQDEVYHILRKWRMREYGKDGKGSPFPISETSINQTKTEIWYQMSHYLVERYL